MTAPFPPNPFVVRSFPRGGVDYCLLSDAIAHDLNCIMQGLYDNIPCLVGRFNTGDEARAFMPNAHRLIRAGRDAADKRATEAAAATQPAPASGHRNSPDQNLPATGTHGGERE
jgi:hypothetical protein